VLFINALYPQSYRCTPSSATPNGRTKSLSALLRDLVEYFSCISLGKKVWQADILGQLYEYLCQEDRGRQEQEASE
jgi:hypothetical protein